MSGLITPILLIALSVGAFMLYIQPTYSGVTSATDYKERSIQQLLKDKATLDEAVENAKKLVEKRKSLEAVRNGITEPQVKNLDKLLPSNMDGVRLAYDLDTLARAKGMALSGLVIGIEKNNDSPAGEINSGQNTDAVGTVDISFSVKGTYQGIKEFLESVENSLRVADIQSMSFGEEDESGFYDLKIAMVIYWLK
jgi:Tfp pilus assembly protein PilO